MGSATGRRSGFLTQKNRQEKERAGRRIYGLRGLRETSIVIVKCHCSERAQDTARLLPTVLISGACFPLISVLSGHVTLPRDLMLHGFFVYGLSSVLLHEDRAFLFSSLLPFLRLEQGLANSRKGLAVNFLGILGHVLCHDYLTKLL